MTDMGFWDFETNTVGFALTTHLSDKLPLKSSLETWAGTVEHLGPVSILLPLTAWEAWPQVGDVLPPFRLASQIQEAEITSAVVEASLTTETVGARPHLLADGVDPGIPHLGPWRAQG